MVLGDQRATTITVIVTNGLGFFKDGDQVCNHSQSSLLSVCNCIR